MAEVSHKSDITGQLAASLRAGQFDRAEGACRALIALDPADADAWFNLGYVLRGLRRFEAALDAYGEAILRGMARAEDAHVNRAALLIEHLLRPGEAREELEAALAANPDSVAALLSLGQLHEDLGDAEAAAQTYRRLIEVAPGTGRAHARLAGFELARGEIEPAIARLQRAAGLVPGRSDDQAEVVMALGQGFEKAGRFDHAYAAYDMANNIARQLVPPSGRYDARAVEALVDAQIAAFPIGTAHAEGGEQQGPTPLFICGMLRSGSTLAERVLARHPRVTAGGEMEAIPAMAGGLADYPACVMGLTGDALAALRGQYFAEAGHTLGAFDVLTDKRPDNFLHLGLIKRLFPGARIVSTRRNRYDIALSVFGNLFGPGVPYAHSLANIAHWQAQHDRLMAHWQACWPDDVLAFDYDLLVRDPSGAIAQLLAHCGLDWDEACLTPSADSNASAGGVRTLSQWQVRQPIHTRASGRAEPFSRWLNRS